MKGIILSLFMRYLPEILEMAFDYLRDLAKESENKIDDKAVEILEQFAKSFLQEKKKPSSSRISIRKRR